MMRLARDRPANTQVILQGLAEIDGILNSPPAPPSRQIPQVAATVPSLPPQQPVASPSLKQPAKFASSGSDSGGLTRRQLINAASLGAVGLVGGVIVHQTWKGSSPSPTSTNSPSSQTEESSLAQQRGINLQSFEFEVVTVDSQGKENNRSRRQANFFTEDLSNGIMLEMVAIPGGTFMMGSPATEEGRYERESPQHSVTIKPFYLGKFTVTQVQWRAVATLAKVIRDLNSDPAYFKGDNLPVEQISWSDSKEFCARLSRETGRTYRLPSEAEWEYACRAGTNTPFHFGETITTDLANYDGNSTYSFGPAGKYREKTTPVGSFQVANDFGLYDMHGNVWEWCEDHWHKNYQGAPKDGSVWIKENVNESDSHYNFRSLRGCSWGFGPRFCRSAYRDLNELDYRDSDISFRVVCPTA
ncbi:MAG: formylglycine-generating enzyme family protein [Symploca sp. SIO2C1]|nr:formylglycine-generating enzyme family protein [Symploca sp. SIO2C1]